MGQRMRTVFVLSLVSIQVALLLAGFTYQPGFQGPTALPIVKNEIRIDHAKELFGPGYRSSIARRGEIATGIEEFLVAKMKSRLPQGWRSQAWEIVSIVIEESNQHGIDPLFVMAMIERESRFNPAALGRHGEIGLMQIKPETAAWIAKRTQLAWHGKQSLFNPIENVRFGVAYISHLRQRYDKHGHFYLSAYNVGPARLNKLVNESRMPSEYARSVMIRYSRLYQDLVRYTLVRAQNQAEIRLASR